MGSKLPPLDLKTSDRSAAAGPVSNSMTPPESHSPPVPASPTGESIPPAFGEAVRTETERTARFGDSQADTSTKPQEVELQFPVEADKIATPTLVVSTSIEDGPVSVGHRREWEQPDYYTPQSALSSAPATIEQQGSSMSFQPPSEPPPFDLEESWSRVRQETSHSLERLRSRSEQQRQPPSVQFAKPMVEPHGENRSPDPGRRMRMRRNSEGAILTPSLSMGPRNNNSDTTPDQRVLGRLSRTASVGASSGAAWKQHNWEDRQGVQRHASLGAIDAPSMSDLGIAAWVDDEILPPISPSLTSSVRNVISKWKQAASPLSRSASSTPLTSPQEGDGPAPSSPSLSLSRLGSAPKMMKEEPAADEDNGGADETGPTSGSPRKSFDDDDRPQPSSPKAEDGASSMADDSREPLTVHQMDALGKTWIAGEQGQWMMNPHCVTRGWIDAFVWLLIIYSLFAVSYSAAFLGSTLRTVRPLRIFEQLVDALFCLDFVLEFRTSRFDQQLEGYLVDPRDIFSLYLRGHATLDFASVVPWELCSLKYRHYVRLLKFLRFTRLRNFGRGAQVINTRVVGQIGRLVTLLFHFLLLTHCIACAGFGISHANRFEEDTWAGQLELEGHSTWTQYLRSLFYALTLTTGIGNTPVPPVLNSEVAFVCFAMIVGSAFWAYAVGMMFDLISSINKEINVYEENLDQLKYWMEYRKLPGFLKDTIIRHFNYQWSRHRFIDENTVMGNLSPALQLKLRRYLCKDIVSSVPIFKNTPSTFIDEIVSRLRPKFVPIGEVVCKEGEMGHEMFIISKGRVEVLKAQEEGPAPGAALGAGRSRGGSSAGGPPGAAVPSPQGPGPSSTKLNRITVLESGSFFGEVSLIYEVPRICTCRAISQCDLFTLTKTDFYEVMESYPSQYSKISQIANQRAIMTQGTDLEEEEKEEEEEEQEEQEEELEEQEQEEYEAEGVEVAERRDAMRGPAPLERRASISPSAATPDPALRRMRSARHSEAGGDTTGTRRLSQIRWKQATMAVNSGGSAVNMRRRMKLRTSMVTEQLLTKQRRSFIIPPLAVDPRGSDPGTCPPTLEEDPGTCPPTLEEDPGTCPPTLEEDPGPTPARSTAGSIDDGEDPDTGDDRYEQRCTSSAGEASGRPASLSVTSVVSVESEAGGRSRASSLGLLSSALDAPGLSDAEKERMVSLFVTFMRSMEGAAPPQPTPALHPPPEPISHALPLSPAASLVSRDRDSNGAQSTEAPTGLDASNSEHPQGEDAEA